MKEHPSFKRSRTMYEVNKRASLYRANNPEIDADRLLLMVLIDMVGELQDALQDGGEDK